MADTRFSKSRQRKAGQIALLVLGTILMGGCAHVNFPNIGEEGFHLEADEARLYKRSEELSKQLDRSSHLYRNPALERYLTDLANRLRPKAVQEAGMNFKVKVIKDPTLNAFAMPNGRIYVHTGILAVMDNEAQLAALLAHEMTHTIHRHALRQLRTTTNTSALLASLYVPLVYVSGGAGVGFSQLVMVSSITGYSRSLEEDADKTGFEMIKAAGYDVGEAVMLFQHLKKYIEDEDVKEPFFFSTHPRVVSRIQNFEKYIKENPKAAGKNRIRHTEAFLEFWHDIVLTNIDLCLSAGMFKTAETEITNFIRRYPEEAEGYFYKGELYRQRQVKKKRKDAPPKEDNYKMAIGAYQKAINLDPAYAEAYRALGIVYRKIHDDTKAVKAFKKYLALKPDAPDKGYMETFIHRTEGQ